MSLGVVAGLAWERDHTGTTLDGNQDVSEVLSSFAPLPDGSRAGAASSGDTRPHRTHSSPQGPGKLSTKILFGFEFVHETA